MDLIDRLAAKSLPLTSTLLHYNYLSSAMRLVREACLSHSFFFFLFEYGLLPIFSLLIFIQTVVRKDFDEVPLVLRLKYKDFLLIEYLRVE